MEKIILKQAKLKNSGVWTTTITWYSLGSGTQIVTKQCYTRKRKNNYTRVEDYTKKEFDKAYKEFHKKIAEWI